VGVGGWGIPIEIAEYDPNWPAEFEQAAARIRSALGAAVLALEHVGSTAVPGLASKPVIDINLVVADSAREDAYAAQLESAGFRLTIREPVWFEHRMFVTPDPRVNLHVFALNCPEVERVRLFRDWLRQSAGDRALYAETKRNLAQRNWSNVQDYADAKQHVIEEIMGRARAWAAHRSKTVA
jgi:GrpB-like predicted nucleotidyltransferase (UPF0157 family)